jgi:penicillin amidase
VPRALKIVNAFIAIVLLAAAAVTWWVAIRVLPRKSGLAAAPVSAKVLIARDERGVPQIKAGSIEDALFAQGFATAQDRLFQMEFMRRRTGGELAEVFGSVALPGDIEAAHLQLARLAERHAADLTPGDRTLFAAYARGVNHYLETHRGRLPLEFTLARLEPRPWRIADSILVALMMFRDLTTTWPQDLLKEAMLASGDPGKVHALFPVRAGGEVQPGSNAWVISGKWTRSGKPILANDPHLEFSLPGIWYQAHLEAPGLKVAGATIPGLPCVIVGHNERVAWGVTNLHFDVQDLYPDLLDPRTTRIEPARIRVRHGRDADVATLVTRHGPVVHRDLKRALALRWTAADAFAFPFLDIGRAGGWSSFRAALARFPGPAQNFVYADVDGNIGYQAAGRLPVRATHAGDVPGDGEWDGTIPFENLPSSFNPPSGVIVTANQNPFPADYRYPVAGSFAPPYRARQILARLERRRDWTPDDMLGVQTDIYSAPDHAIARHAVAAADKRGSAGGALGEAVALLRQWNGLMDEKQAAPFIATLTFRHLRKAIAERASPGNGAAYESQMSLSVVERLLADRPPGWFDDYDHVVLRALADAVEEGARMQGRDPAKWRWGLANEWRLEPALVRELPVLNRYWRIGPVPMSGSQATVKQTTPRLGPSMRFVADLSDWDKSLMNILTGQSGQIFSSHFRDQWDAYLAGRSFPMSYRRGVVKSSLKLTPER